MTRTSLVEQYNNRDVVAQIYRLISLVESSTITSIETEKRGDAIVLILNMYDGTEQRFHFSVDGIEDITTLQNGSVETVYIHMDSGRVYTFTFDIAIAGMTTDTVQDVTATKTFTAPQVFEGGITGPLQIDGTTVIDGEVQVSNGHSLAVAGDVECANAVNSESAEIGNLAIEPNGARTVLSNESGITITGTTTVDVPTNNPGIRDTKAVNGTRVENSLDAYAPMVRNTGNRELYGETTLYGLLKMCNTRTGVVNRGLGWHRVASFNTDARTKYMAVTINDRYQSANARVTFTIDATVSPPVITANGTTTVENPQRTAIGLMFDESTETYHLVFNRVSGSNIYTNFTIDFIQVGTASSNMVIVQDEDTVLTEAPTIYSEVMVI